MDGFRDHVEMAVRLDSSGENEGHSGQYPVELTPPHTSSVGEPTPTSEESDGSPNPIGCQGGNDSSNNNITNAPTEELVSAIEDAVSSHIKTTSPLATCKTVQAIAKNNIARLTEEDIPSHRGLELRWNDMNACLTQEDARLTGSRIPIQSREPLRIVRRDIGIDYLHREGYPITARERLGNSLDISLRISTEGPSGPSGIPLSPKTGRVRKKRTGSARRQQSSRDANSDVQGPRRGRPSERGFSCSRCAIAKKRCVGDDINCCDACLKSPIYRHLCIKADFKDSRLLPHALYATRISTLIGNVAEFTPPNPTSVPIRIAISNGFDSQLDIELRRYVALDDDALTHTIFRGLDAGMEYPTARSTPFALKEGTLTREKIDVYCEKLASDMILRELKISTRNSLLNHIIAFAVTQINNEDVKARVEGLEIVRLALRFWAIQAIFFTYPWRIEKGGHLIGMFPLQLRGYWNGITLLPRLVNQELDRAFETRMDEIEKEVLEKLQAAIFKRHRDYWCSIFLSSFILLHSLERDTWNMSAWDYETRGRGPAAWPLRRTPSEYCAQNKYIADIIATHFKIVNQGSSPLKQNWKKPLNQQLLSDSLPARMFILSIQSDFNSSTSNYKSELEQPAKFARSDAQSLNYIYTKMLFAE